MSSDYFDYVDSEVEELNAEEAVVQEELHQQFMQEQGGAE